MSPTPIQRFCKNCRHWEQRKTTAWGILGWCNHPSIPKLESTGKAELMTSQHSTCDHFEAKESLIDPDGV